ncbi:MAG: DUF1499 domain-containing protein [Pseudomonadota bacterium]|nr:DUF1499 domain-containing protein [Pseudomonadota bacterium]
MVATRTSRWPRRLTLAAALLCFGGVTAALVAALGSAEGAWHFRSAFTVLRYAAFAAAAGIVVAIAGAIVSRRAGRGLVVTNLVALLVAAGFVAFIGNQVRIVRSVPAIHDISTNLEDLPQFFRLTVRSDNLDTIPDLGRPELAALPPLERWKAIHRESYGDIATIRVPWSVAETVERARALAEERGWEIAAVDPQRGILEATETSRFFRFKDDVVVRVRPDSDGSGAMVDMRSISRVGVSDVGVNARRVRSFLADLQRG